MHMAGAGFAAPADPTSRITYQLVNLWSRVSTWGGNQPPAFNESVFIPSGQSILLDISPPLLQLVVVEGELIFDPEATQAIELQAKWILVTGNLSIHGATPLDPYPGKATITLFGAPNSRELPIYGAKNIAVRDGLVRFHGKPKTPTWTVLESSADVGATAITVQGALSGWEDGDTIAIASSSVYATDIDEVKIAGLVFNAGSNTTTINLASPLQFTHLGEVVSHPDDPTLLKVVMRAEVAVLDRNVVVQGDETSEANMYGAQVLVSTPRTAGRARAAIRFDNVEFRQMGQAFRLGRYAIHWHMHGFLNYTSWVRSCSIHHTYNRAVTIHGSHEAILQNNVAYNVMGHTFFLEDGIETGNIVEGNLGLNTRVSNALLNTDTSPATFWITNPNNTYRNNHAAGSAAYGYWVRLLDHPEGPSFTTTVCPKFNPLGEFSNNHAHSNLFYGLRVHPEYYPRHNPCQAFTSGTTFQQVPAVFRGTVAYKNGVKGAIATQVGLVQFRDFSLADNGAGPVMHIVNGKDNGGAVEFSWIVDDRNRKLQNVTLGMMAGLHNAVIFARTSVGMRGTAGQWPSGRKITAVITQSPPLGDPNHSALMSLINNTYVGYVGGQFSALEHCGKVRRH